VMPLVTKLDPDVVILDIAMPGRSGYTVARDIAEKFPQKPMVIAITGKAIDPADQMLSEIGGFDHYLLKPYSPDELLALLKLRMRELRLVAARQPVKPRSLN
jgi:DNA-binding response OmpR family regulator